MCEDDGVRMMVYEDEGACVRMMVCEDDGV